MTDPTRIELVAALQAIDDALAAAEAAAATADDVGVPVLANTIRGVNIVQEMNRDMFARTLGEPLRAPDRVELAAAAEGADPDAWTLDAYQTAAGAAPDDPAPALDADAHDEADAAEYPTRFRSDDPCPVCERDYDTATSGFQSVAAEPQTVDLPPGTTKLCVDPDEFAIGGRGVFVYAHRAAWEDA